MSTQASLLESSLLNLFSSSIVPPLLPTADVKPNLIHKGVAGRILVVGGSNEYAGAPYFSAQSAFRAVSLLLSILILYS
jgi:NAD(P)H-hydrate repair Nnr-like enzyme with NAD(P)H-hydrate dehydratase domain